MEKKRKLGQFVSLKKKKKRIVHFKWIVYYILIICQYLLKFGWLSWNF